MHLHFLGISGTFMSALALLARASGHVVTGSDTACYPPISDLLTENNISWTDGYDSTQAALSADRVIVGNALKRGMPVVEAILDARKSYTSGPAWLAQEILPRYRVIAVAGTHGKTTTTSMLAFILHYAGLQPGFLIGGVSSDFNTSAQLGTGEWFVIESDEYDSAFFDKRPKFMHYRPEIAILNNLEFDHADIYPDLAAIQTQFHYFLRTIPANGLVLSPQHDTALNQVLERGLWSEHQTISLHGQSDWRAEVLDPSGGVFVVWHKGCPVAQVEWDLMGHFNVENGLAAIAASARAGVDPKLAAAALSVFTPVKRRLEVKLNQYGITVYDDFAHHPTAIMKTTQALHNSARHTRIIAVLEFASYTMRSGIHDDVMVNALQAVDLIYCLSSKTENLEMFSKKSSVSYVQCGGVTDLLDAMVPKLRAGDAVLIMSNRGFGDIHTNLVKRIHKRFAQDQIQSSSVDF